jgi:hypothetical protein
MLRRIVTRRSAAMAAAAEAARALAPPPVPSLMAAPAGDEEVEVVEVRPGSSADHMRRLREWMQNVREQHAQVRSL